MTGSIYRIRIDINGCKPPIWRRLELPGDFTLERVSRCVLTAFGWHGSHLHQFEANGQLYDIPDPEFELFGRKIHSEKRVRLHEIASEGSSFTYTYDFGDNWVHKIRVESIVETEEGVTYPRCVAGKRSGPPEDSGGPWGFADPLVALADPDNKEHASMREWVGPYFEPETWDIDFVNLELAKLAVRPKKTNSSVSTPKRTPSSSALGAQIRQDILPLFRTQADLHRYSRANKYASSAHRGLSALEALATSPENASELRKPIENAISATVKIILRADDSSGMIGDVIRGLLRLHARICRMAPPDHDTLIRWILAFMFDGEQDFFEIDIVDYVDGLGDIGIKKYETALAEIDARTPRYSEAEEDRLWRMSSDESPEAADFRIHRHNRFLLDYNAKRLAVVHHDTQSIIETVGGSLKMSYQFEAVAKALAEIGAFDRAIEMAERGTMIDGGHQAVSCARYWYELLTIHQSKQLFDACWTVLRRWPNQEHAARLFRASGDKWSSIEAEVFATLETNRVDYVTFMLNDLRDAESAWHHAERLKVESPYVWASLITAYANINPFAVIPKMRHLVELDLESAGIGNYRSAVKRLKQLRDLGTRTNTSDEAHDYAMRLRNEHRNRPRFLQEFDKAKLWADH